MRTHYPRRTPVCKSFARQRACCRLVQPTVLKAVGVQPGHRSWRSGWLKEIERQPLVKPESAFTRLQNASRFGRATVTLQIGLREYVAANVSGLPTLVRAAWDISQSASNSAAQLEQLALAACLHRGSRAIDCTAWLPSSLITRKGWHMTRRFAGLLFTAGALAVVIPVTSGISARALELRPNLVAFAAAPLSLSVVREGGVTNLRFATTSWNNGSGPLELRAGEVSADGQKRRVYQRVYFSDGTYYEKNAGDFEYHPEHGHFHFGNYALYTLKPVNAPGASLRESSKTTFCVMDTTKVNTSLPGAPQSAVYSTCGADIQGMSVGWGDTYGASLAGQSFDVTNLPTGDYDLIIEIDPKTVLVENTRVDNISCLRLHLNPSARTVQSLGSCTTQGTVTIDTISPDFINQGTVLLPVTITGSGFASGMAVGFENGSGPAPIGTAVTVIDANTLTLNVSVAAKGGGRRERLWDVRVSSAVKPKSFAVRP